MGAPSVMNVPRVSNRIEAIDHSAFKVNGNMVLAEENAGTPGLSNSGPGM